LKFGYDKVEVAKAVREAVAEQRSIRGTCVTPRSLDLG
jgi:hypothetical protein